MAFLVSSGSFISPALRKAVQARTERFPHGELVRSRGIVSVWLAVVVQAPQLSRSACGGRHMKGLVARPLATLWDGRESVGRYPVIEGRMAGFGGIASR